MDRREWILKIALRIAEEESTLQAMKYASYWLSLNVLNDEDILKIDAKVEKIEAQRLAELEAQKEAEQIEEVPEGNVTIDEATEEVPNEGVIE